MYESLCIELFLQIFSRLKSIARKIEKKPIAFQTVTSRWQKSELISKTRNVMRQWRFSLGGLHSAQEEKGEKSRSWSSTMTINKVRSNRQVYYRVTSLSDFKMSNFYLCVRMCIDATHVQCRLSAYHFHYLRSIG